MRTKRQKSDVVKQERVLGVEAVKIDYFIESTPQGFLFTSRKTLETNE